MPTLRVTARTLNMQARPCTEHEVVARLPWDFSVEKLEESGSWLEVRRPKGEEGWISARHAAPAAPGGGGGPTYGRHRALDSDPPG